MTTQGDSQRPWRQPLGPKRSVPLSDNVTVDIDPLDGTCHALLAATGPDGERVHVRLYVPEVEREDWRKVVEVMRGA